jgi:Ca2+-binding EF-hand superfamily protein
MMRAIHWLPGVAALAMMIGGGIAVADGETSSLPLRGPIPFEVFDLDGSGAISEQEFDQVRARRARAREKAGLSPSRWSRPFGSVDADGDGAISRAELRASHEARGDGPRLGPGAGRGRGMGRGDGPRRGPGSGRGRGMGRGDGPPSFSDFDLNGDGAIDEPEFAEARAARVARRAEEGRSLRRMPTAPPFAELDTDGDGRLTQGEFGAGVQRHWEGTSAGARDGGKQ